MIIDLCDSPLPKPSSAAINRNNFDSPEVIFDKSESAQLPNDMFTKSTTSSKVLSTLKNISKLTSSIQNQNVVAINSIATVTENCENECISQVTVTEKASSLSSSSSSSSSSSTISQSSKKSYAAYLKKGQRFQKKTNDSINKVLEDSENELNSQNTDEGNSTISTNNLEILHKVPPTNKTKKTYTKPPKSSSSSSSSSSQPTPAVTAATDNSNTTMSVKGSKNHYSRPNRIPSSSSSSSSLDYTRKSTNNTTNNDNDRLDSSNSNNNNKTNRNIPTYYQEIAMTIDPSILCIDTAIHMLKKFTLDQAGTMYLYNQLYPPPIDPISTTTTNNNNAASKKTFNKVSKTSKAKLDVLQQEVDKNKILAIADKSYFNMYTDMKLQFPGLCLWTHRKLEYGGHCHLGNKDSTLYPFVVIVYSAQRFIDLLYHDTQSSRTVVTTQCEHSRQQQCTAKINMESSSSSSSTLHISNQIISLDEEDDDNMSQPRQNYTNNISPSSSSSSSSSSSNSSSNNTNLNATTYDDKDDRLYQYLREDIYCIQQKLNSLFRKYTRIPYTTTNDNNNNNANESTSSIRITLVIEKLDEYAVQKIQTQMAIDPTVSVFQKLDDAIMYLVHEMNIDIVQVRHRSETYDYLHTVTRILVESMYRKKVHELDCVTKRKLNKDDVPDYSSSTNASQSSQPLLSSYSLSQESLLPFSTQQNRSSSSSFSSSSFSHGPDINQEQREFRQVWTNMIEMIPGVSRQRAIAFTKKYTTPLSVLRAIRTHPEYKTSISNTILAVSSTNNVSTTMQIQSNTMTSADRAGTQGFDGRGTAIMSQESEIEPELSQYDKLSLYHQIMNTSKTGTSTTNKNTKRKNTVDTIIKVKEKKKKIENSVMYMFQQDFNQSKNKVNTNTTAATTTTATAVMTSNVEYGDNSNYSDTCDSYSNTIGRVYMMQDSIYNDQDNSCNNMSQSSQLLSSQLSQGQDTVQKNGQNHKKLSQYIYKIMTSMNPNELLD